LSFSLRRVNTLRLAYAFGKANYHYAIFWLSSPQSNHSQHIIDNPNISGEIIDQTMPQGTGFKIKFRGPAYAMDDLSDQRLHRGYEFLKDKLTQFPQTLGDLVKNDSLKKIYMMRVEDVTVNAAIEYEGQIGWKDISLNHDAPTSNVLHLAHEMNFHVD